MSPIAQNGILPQVAPHSPITHLGTSYSQPMDIPMPAHKQVIRTAVDRQVLIPQSPERKVVN